MLMINQTFLNWLNPVILKTQIYEMNDLDGSFLSNWKFQKNINKVDCDVFKIRIYKIYLTLIYKFIISS